jgi:hypothetical protein
MSVAMTGKSQIVNLHRYDRNSCNAFELLLFNEFMKVSFNLIGRQSAKSLGCIRKSIKKNLHLMHENVRMTFESYLTQCGEGITPNDGSL